MTQEAFANNLESLLDDYLDFGVPQAGEIRNGFIVAHRSNNELLVDIGAKSEGIIPNDEFDQLSDSQRANLSVGNEIRVCIMNPEDDSGNIIVSHVKVAEQEDWILAQSHQESQEPCEVKFIGCNRGGILAQLGTLRGFIPASQLGSVHQINRQSSPIEQLRQLVGNTANVVVLEADREQERLIMSELAAEQKGRAARRAVRISELREGGSYNGRVINVTDFGVFVDIGDIEGLVHASELSWKHIRKPGDLYKLGDEVKVSILAIDTEKERITLSIKQTETNPWEVVEDLYPIGALVEVTVTQLAHYGAFARINDEYRLEGLLHISEMASDHIKSPGEVVKKGEILAVRIIRVDTDQKQIGFSIKQIADGAEQDIDISALMDEAEAEEAEEADRTTPEPV